MTKSFSGRRLYAAAALTAVSLVGGGLAMAPTASASTPAPASARAPRAQVTPDGNVVGCQTVLDNFGELNAATKAVCIVTATFAVFNSSKAYGHCVISLSGLGVNTRVAMTACSFAAFG